MGFISEFQYSDFIISDSTINFRGMLFCVHLWITSWAFQSHWPSVLFPYIQCWYGCFRWSRGILAGVGCDRISCVLSIDGVDALMLKVKRYSVLSTWRTKILSLCAFMYSLGVWFKSVCKKWSLWWVEWTDNASFLASSSQTFKTWAAICLACARIAFLSDMLNRPEPYGKLMNK